MNIASHMERNHNASRRQRITGISDSISMYLVNHMNNGEGTDTR
jgi:hypothetical protein